MDLIHRGRPDLAQAYLTAYIERSGDREQPSLMPALVSYRAMVRAKVGALAATSPDLQKLIGKPKRRKPEDTSSSPPPPRSVPLPF